MIRLNKKKILHKLVDLDLNKDEFSVMLGLNKTTFARYFSGNSDGTYNFPRADTLYLIHEKLGLSFDEIIEVYEVKDE